MRTRIALVAIVPVALITVSTCTQAAIAQPARVVLNSSRPTIVRNIPMAPVDSVVRRRTVPHAPAKGEAALPFINSAPLVTHIVTTTGTTTPNTIALAALARASAPAPPLTVGPVDTVTPDQRAAWEQVAMCEEGGDWSSDGPSFSGGLGITRANWDAYGGLEFAPEGADASEDQQIMVAERIQPSPPDQSGCSGW
jgi:hypothetical protein